MSVALQLARWAYRAARRTPLLKWRWCRAIARRLWRRIVPKRLFRVETIAGSLWVDSRDEGVAPSLLATGAYEPYETRLLHGILQPGMVFVDIGANIGYYTSLAAARVGARGRVIAIEPAPQNFSLLRRNIAESDNFHVEVYQCALGGQSTTGVLYLSETNAGDHRTFAMDDPERSKIPTSIRRLDDLIDASTHIDVVKMDIQGAEPAALAGMTGLLKANRDIVLFTEFWPAAIKQSGYCPRDFLHRLRQSGFRLRRIDEAQERLEDFTLQAANQLCESHRHVNLLAVRGAYASADFDR